MFNSSCLQNLRDRSLKAARLNIMALRDSAASKRIDNDRSTTHRRRKRKSRKNDPGILGSVLHYLAQEAHSFVTNLSGVNENQDTEEDSAEVNNLLPSFSFRRFRVFNIRSLALVMGLKKQKVPRLLYPVPSKLYILTLIRELMQMDNSQNMIIILIFHNLVSLWIILLHPDPY
jgi:hypothetical protein